MRTDARGGRRGPAVALLALALVGAGAGAAQWAWACIPQPRLVSVLPRSSGPAGAKVTVDGLGFDPGRAEVRWNGLEGELLGAATGPDFSLEVTIPEVPAGLYALLVISRAAGGAVGNTGRASFQVTGPDGPGPDVTASTAPTSTVGAPAPSSSESSSPSPNPALAAGLVAAGGAGGAAGTMVLQRRRRRAP